MSYAAKIWNMWRHDYMTLDEIANVFGVSRQYIHKTASKEGYSFPKLPKYGSKDPRCREKEQFLNILRSHFSFANMSEELNIPPKCIPSWIKHHGLSKKEMIPHCGNNHFLWKGGRFVDSKSGYVWIDCNMVDYYSINPDWKSKKVHEHKYLIEKYVLNGKILPRKYCVHHRDEDRSNNDLANLCILTLRQHMRFHNNYLSKAKEQVLDWDDFKIRTIGNRMDNLLDVWHSSNLALLKIDYYLEDRDIFDISVPLENDPHAYLLDQIRPEAKYLPLYGGPGYKEEVEIEEL